MAKNGLGRTLIIGGVSIAAVLGCIRAFGAPEWLIPSIKETEKTDGLFLEKVLELTAAEFVSGATRTTETKSGNYIYETFTYTLDNGDKIFIISNTNVTTSGASGESLFANTHKLTSGPTSCSFNMTIDGDNSYYAILQGDTTYYNCFLTSTKSSFSDNQLSGFKINSITIYMN